jgi:hypothetical protein
MRGRGTDKDSGGSRRDEQHGSDETLNLGLGGPRARMLGHFLVLSGRALQPL